MGDDSTAAAAASAAHQQDLRKQLEVLDVQRRSLEFESEAIVTELTTSDNTRIPPMGIDTPLVDREGFPRNDIDVLRARTLRSRLMTIRTDHKLLLQQIDAQLAILAAATKTATDGMSEEPEQHKKEELEEETAARSAPKPKPKFDPLTGKWVVRNWDGSMYVVSARNEPKVGRSCCSLSLAPPSLFYLLPSNSLLLFLLLVVVDFCYFAEPVRDKRMDASSTSCHRKCCRRPTALERSLIRPRRRRHHHLRRVLALILPRRPSPPAAVSSQPEHKK
jgi:hypothetical protein